MRLRNTEAADATARRSGRVTITDVAASLGLAKGTVSRALNGYPDIAESTRLRVTQAAHRLGYSPLAHAQAIRTGRVRALGIVLQIGEHDAQRPFLAEFLAGLTTAASAENWTVTVATAPTEDETLATMRRLIDERKADGFVLPRTKAVDPRIALLRSEGVPFVLWGRTEDPTGCAWFDILGEDAMAEAAHRLWSFGHRRIGYIGGAAGYNYTRLRRRGFLKAAERLGLEVDEALLAEDGATVENGAACARHLLAADNPPTAIVCATDVGALGAFREIKAAGLTVGRDVSVIGYDGIPEGVHASPGLTTFEVDNRDAGARLAQLLIRYIRGEAPESLRETARATLKPRASDGPPSVSSTRPAERVASTKTKTTKTNGRLQCHD